MKKFCKKCLIADLDYDEELAHISEYIKNVPYDKRCDEKTYKMRLDVCRSCDELSNGICAKCGCYVELRALKPNMYCASENKYW